MDAHKVTTVEATTGSFEDVPAAPGRIDELRIDIARTAPRCHDNQSVTAKSAQSSGYASLAVSNLVHGQAVTIAARVSGIDRGVDVVSVGDQVHYRPDLLVGSIDAPSSPAVGVPIAIAASVREGKGDEGATADCVLSVDGVASDRATGIWVDAAGLVTCHFTTTFASAGPHRLAVDVLNVAPRDYDSNNNHAEITIQAIPQFNFSGSVIDTVYSGEDIEDVIDPSGALAYHRDDTYTGRNQSASLSGTWPKAVTFPLVSLKATAASGGGSWSLIDVSGLPAAPADGSGMTCGSGSDTTGYNWVSVCAFPDVAGPATQVSISSFAGEVTYHSVGVCQTTSSFYDCAGGYTWNSDSDSQAVAYQSIARQLAFGLSIVDSADLALSAAPVVPVAPYATSDDVPRACDPQPDGSQHCTSHSYAETGLAGAAQQ
jgi:hypothetical protein